MTRDDWTILFFAAAMIALAAVAVALAAGRG